jgi:ATP-binding cassette, subfamily B, bacterial PglK
MKFYNAIIKPLLAMLDSSAKKKGTWIIGLMVFNAMLDFFSLASFLPLIFLLINPKAISSNGFINSIYSTFNFTTPAQFIIALTICVLLFTLIKNIVGIWITHSKANYSFSIGSDISSHLLSRYLEMSYLNFTQADFSKEINRIANLPIAFANNIIMPLANLISEGLVFLDSNVFLLLLPVLTPIGLLYRSKRNRISQTSTDLKEKYPLTLKYALQVVEGFVDIKVSGKESFFKNRFGIMSKSLAKTFTQEHTTQTGVSRLTEIVAGVVICSLIIYSVLTHQNYRQTIMLLGVYAGVSLRMIPSLNRILNAVLQIKSHEYLFRELDGSAKGNSPEIQETTRALDFRTIELNGISFRYPDGAHALNHASITIHKGEKIALTGTSGTGKTTLLTILLQLIRADTGKILLNGTEIQADDTMSWRNLFAYVSQSPYLLDGTLFENIAFGISKEQINHQKVAQLISDLDLQEMIDQLPNGPETYIGEKGVRLSGGQRQRIAIARALYAEAEILLLDEVTNQLDAKSEQEVLQTLEKVALQNKTIVMITHHEHLMNRFDRILFIEDGKILEKTAPFTLFH